MRKAIRLQVSLWIEGEDEPAHDFYESTARAVREIIEAGRDAHRELRVRVERVEERSAEDEGEDLLAEEDG